MTTQVEKTPIEIERALTHRAELCEQTLARMVEDSNVTFTIEKRLKSMGKCMKSEPQTVRQIALSEHMVTSLHDELREVRRAINAPKASTIVQFLRRKSFYEKFVLTSPLTTVPTLCKIIEFCTEGSGLDLATLDLSYADLDEASLADVVLRGVTLSGASMRGVDLAENAYLANVRLTSAILDGARLDGCYLDGANLANASLKGASAVGARLSLWPSRDRNRRDRQ